MTDKWTVQLSAYLDGELDSVDRAALEAHLASCDECRVAVEQLRGVVGWAQAYQGSNPQRDVWPQIAGEIRKSPQAAIKLGAEREARSWWRRLTVPQAVAAAVSLLLVGSGSWWVARATAPRDRIAAVIDVSAPPEGFTVAAAIHAAKTYGPAIADLERFLLSEQTTLDTATVRVLREKLAIIDRAMAEAQDALAQDPNSGYLIDHYTEMMRKKLSVLRAVARRAEAET
jgi:anti-sigma factor RsiW